MIYDIADFRKNTREAFNAVDRGEEVIVLRYGVPYTLKRSLKEKIVVSVLDKKSEATTAPKNLAEMWKGRFCKEGHSIPEGRSKCMGKGCRYS